MYQEQIDERALELEEEEEANEELASDIDLLQKELHRVIKERDELKVTSAKKFDEAQLAREKLDAAVKGSQELMGMLKSSTGGGASRGGRPGAIRGGIAKSDSGPDAIDSGQCGDAGDFSPPVASPHALSPSGSSAAWQSPSYSAAAS